MDKLTNKQKTAIIATISAVFGATGGTYVGTLTDTELKTFDQIIIEQQSNADEGKEMKQILKGGHKPSDAVDKTQEAAFPEDVRVDVYDGPKGKGYVIVKEYPTYFLQFASGPEAEERTGIFYKPDILINP